jgi:hypothetical protein
MELAHGADASNAAWPQLCQLVRAGYGVLAGKQQ